MGKVKKFFDVTVTHERDHSFDPTAPWNPSIVFAYLDNHAVGLYKEMLIEPSQDFVLTLNKENLDWLKVGSGPFEKFHHFYTVTRKVQVSTEKSKPKKPRKRTRRKLNVTHQRSDIEPSKS